MSTVFSAVFKNTKYFITFVGGCGTNLGIIKETLSCEYVMKSDKCGSVVELDFFGETAKSGHVQCFLVLNPFFVGVSTSVM